MFNENNNKPLKRKIIYKKCEKKYTKFKKGNKKNKKLRSS